MISSSIARISTVLGYVSYNGVLYGLPGVLELAGKFVQVHERKEVMSVWSAGMQIFEIAKRPRSQDSVPIPNSAFGLFSYSNFLFLP